MRLKELRMDWRAVTAIVVTTLVLVVHRYRAPVLASALAPLLGDRAGLFDDRAIDSLFLYLLVPLLTVLLVFRQSPARYGFRLGDWKAGLLLTAAICGGAAVVMAFVARSEAFRAYYAPWVKDLVPLLVNTGLDLIGWEFFFRGFLLFALYPACGPHAIILQAVPFTLAHFGKPELETLSCIFGGSLFGYIAWRTGSFLYPFLIHWFLVVITILFASGALG